MFKQAVNQSSTANPTTGTSAQPTGFFTGVSPTTFNQATANVAAGTGTQPTGQQGSGLFGSQTQGTSSTGLFGAPKGDQPTTLFGGQVGQPGAQTTGQQGSGLFGSQTQGTPSTGLFGAPQGGQPTNLFGSQGGLFGTGNQPGALSSGAGQVFFGSGGFVTKGKDQSDKQ